MKAHSWQAVAPRPYFFGYRHRPSAVPDWRSALPRRIYDLDFTSGGELLDRRMSIGHYDFEEVTAVVRPRPDAARWASPHPCQALGQTLGFLAVRWRGFLPRERRAAVSERICFALRGFVLRGGTGDAIDGVALGALTLGMLTSKYGTDGMLFDGDDAYADYVERETAKVARRAGLSAYRAGRLVVEGKLAKKVGDSDAHGVELWYFRRGAFDDAMKSGFFDDELTAS